MLKSVLRKVVFWRSWYISRLLKYDADGAYVDCCVRYLDRIRHQNDCAMLSNGESLFLARFGKLYPNPTVFDVGANSGDWASALLDVAPRAYVHCFEPHPATFALLASRFNGNPRVNLHAFGLSNSSGCAPLHGVVLDSGMSSLHRRDTVIRTLGLTEQPTVEVTLKTFDDLVERLNISRVDLLKIDTEGHEVKVIDGASRSLASGIVKTIQFEYGGTWIDSRTFLIDVWRLLENQGYRFYKVAPDRLVPQAQYETVYENFQYCNYLATIDPVVKTFSSPLAA
jgi:FkbM family methyltransferase